MTTTTVPNPPTTIPVMGDRWRIAMICSALLWASTAVAGLKDTPPKKFDATSVGSWQIDPARSDDPAPILKKTREKMAANRSASGRPSRGGMGDGVGGPGGRRGGGGGGRRGLPGGMAQGASPTGSAQADNQLLDDLAHNPPLLTVERADQRVKVLTDEHSSTCRAGVKASFSDSLGSGERHCGWSGSAWVVETTRGKDYTRTDRYEPALDGKTLTYVTSVSGSRIPTVKISRVYVRPVP